MKGQDALIDFLDGILKNDDYFPQDHTDEENIEHYAKFFDEMMKIDFQEEQETPPTK